MEFRTADEVRHSLFSSEALGDDSSDEENFVENHEIDIKEFDIKQEYEDEDEDEDPLEIEEENKNGEAASINLEQDDQRLFIYGRNMYKWYLEPPEIRDQRSNIVPQFPGPKYNAMNAFSPLNIWLLLFTNQMIDMIVHHTNEEIERQQTAQVSSNTNEQTFTKKTTATEIKAFIGLLYFAGVKKDNTATVDELWSTDFGYTVFRATMSGRRFQFLAARLRFDDKNTRAERQKDDLLAPIRDLWNQFIHNCMSNYTPTQEMCIDEMMFGFGGKFKAKVYTNSKPHRSGIKIMCLNDAQTYYLYNALPYTGKIDTLADESATSYYVRTLCEPIYGTNRNVTCGDKFSSVEIFDKMLNEYLLTMVGKVKKSEGHLPKSFKKTTPVGTARYVYDTTKTLLSYCPKRNEVMLLLSSLHRKENTFISSKPEIVEYYNETKGGTERFVQLCDLYTCARSTRRWSMRFFTGMLDQAAVNSGILFNFFSKNNTKDRRQFIKELSLALIIPYLKERIQLPGLQSDVKSCIIKLIGEYNTVAVKKQDKLLKRKRCSLCPTRYDRKVTLCCYECGSTICGEHRRIMCTQCVP